MSLGDPQRLVIGKHVLKGGGALRRKGEITDRRRPSTCTKTRIREACIPGMVGGIEKP